MSIPNHIAIILDGNGRWAKKKGMPRTYGHKVGAENVETICRAADALGVKYLTVYAFSTENWKRSQEEVSALMSIFLSFLKSKEKMAMEENMRIRIIGDKTILDEKLKKQIAIVEDHTKNNTGLQFQMAINYGSRDEMIRGMKKMASDIKEDRLQPEEITEEVFAGYLDTFDIPDPDFMIRTSGEQRLSNYLLWQLAYAEFYFTDVAWPDFSPEELKKAIDVFDSRDRRFGGVKEETKGV